MAATIGYIQSHGKWQDGKRVSRLGHEAMSAEADTWHTFARAYVNKDGSGHVEVERNGKLLHRFDFGKEED